MSPEVSRFEPAQAVFAGETGLESIRELISQAPAILKPGGFLLLEIGYRQAGNIREMTDPSRWELIGICPDLAGIERCAVLKLRR